MTEKSEDKSIYRRGAEDGGVFGAYLIVLFFMSIFSINSPLLSWLALLMMIGVPFLIYRFIGRGRRLTPRYNFFSAYWMHGIIIFVCGALIQSVVTFIYLRFINPMFIPNLLTDTAETLRQIGTADASQLASMFDSIVKLGQVPTPMSIVTSTIWSVSFSGSILSLIIAVIYRVKDGSKRQTNQNNF